MLGAAGLGALGLSGLLASGCATARGGSADAGLVRAGRTRLLRLAHLTDTHIQPERGAFDGVAACLEHVQALDDPPQIIVTGGDLIMDGFDAEYARTRELWDLWSRVLRSHCSLPIAHTLGNHDIWGWNKDKSKTTGAEPGWGKRWACEMVGRDTPWHAVDVAGVRIVILDSTQPDPGSKYGYIAHCDEAQYDWLTRLVAATPRSTPVIVVSHIPILSATGMVDDKEIGVRPKDLSVARGILHADASRLHAMFRDHGGVRACLSGHMHLVDRVEMDGVTYMCDGAVSGGWWKGPNKSCDAGYALVDLFDDGSVERRYVGFGWAYRS